VRAAPERRDRQWPTLGLGGERRRRLRSGDDVRAVRSVGLLAIAGDEVTVGVVLRERGVLDRGVRQPRGRRECPVLAVQPGDLLRELRYTRVGHCSSAATTES